MYTKKTQLMIFTVVIACLTTSTGAFAQAQTETVSGVPGPDNNYCSRDCRKTYLDGNTLHVVVLGDEGNMVAMNTFDLPNNSKRIGENNPIVTSRVTSPVSETDSHKGVPDDTEEYVQDGHVTKVDAYVDSYRNATSLTVVRTEIVYLDGRFISQTSSSATYPLG